MQSPKVSWTVLEEIDTENYEYVQYKNYTEEGSFIPGDFITKKIRVWNNRYGVEDVEDIKNAQLIIAFKNYEDNYLLKLLSFEIDGLAIDQVFTDGELDKGSIPIGNISGAANSGSDGQTSNYKTITFKIGPIPSNIRNELKSIYFYLEYDHE